MADLTFNTKENQTIARGMLILYLNTGTKESPVWSPIGKRVEDSSLEMDWQRDSKKDILDNTYTTMKKPIITKWHQGQFTRQQSRFLFTQVGNVKNVMK